MTGCNSTKSVSCVWQNQLNNAYDSLLLSEVHVPSLDICGATFKNKNNGALFQDVRRLTLNCDSIFTWKHSSCVSCDTSYGNWTVKHNVIYLASSKKVKRKVGKQQPGNMFDSTLI